jgi:hypothetical protein
MMVQLDCGLVRTEGLAPTVNGRKSLCRKEGFFGRLTEWKDLGWMKGFSFGRMEGSRCQERDCAGSAREEREDLDGPRGPLNRARGPRPESSAQLRPHVFAQFLPAHRHPFSFFASFPCSSAHGRGWEEFRLGPGGSGLATRDRATNSHPSVRARGKPRRRRWISRFQFSVLSWSSSGSRSQFFHSHLFGLWSLKYITAVYKPPAGGKH